MQRGEIAAPRNNDKKEEAFFEGIIQKIVQSKLVDNVISGMSLIAKNEE